LDSIEEGLDGVVGPLLHREAPREEAPASGRRWGGEEVAAAIG
jgi:hypothetical protein